MSDDDLEDSLILEERHMSDNPDKSEDIDTTAPAEPTISSLATVVGDDIYLDPPRGPGAQTRLN